jgi:hypothetical protein
MDPLQGEAVSILMTIQIKSNMRYFCLSLDSIGSWQLWKATEPEIFFFFEKHFHASRCIIRPAYEGKKAFIEIELELPKDQSIKLETASQNNLISIELDKIHGHDPVLGRTDVILNKH